MPSRHTEPGPHSPSDAQCFVGTVPSPTHCRRQDLSVGREGISCRRVSAHSRRSWDQTRSLLYTQWEYILPRRCRSSRLASGPEGISCRRVSPHSGRHISTKVSTFKGVEGLHVLFQRILECLGGSEPRHFGRGNLDLGFCLTDIPGIFLEKTGLMI